MNKREEDLLNEIHEMKNLMEYMDSNVISEAASTADIRKTAKTQAKDTDVSGIENVREKEVITALQQLIDKFKAEGNQYSQKVKVYVEKLWGAVNGAGEVNEEVREEGVAQEIEQEYNIEALINKIAKEKSQNPSTVAIMLSKIADRIRAKKVRPN
jgi:hypothetical protein